MCAWCVGVTRHDTRDHVRHACADSCADTRTLVGEEGAKSAVAHVRIAVVGDLAVVGLLVFVLQRLELRSLANGSTLAKHLAAGAAHGDACEHHLGADAHETQRHPAVLGRKPLSNSSHGCGKGQRHTWFTPPKEGGNPCAQASTHSEMCVERRRFTLKRANPIQKSACGQHSGQEERCGRAADAVRERCGNRPASHRTPAVQGHARTLRGVWMLDGVQNPCDEMSGVGNLCCANLKWPGHPAGVVGE